jgi:hypothetical protein
MKMKLTVTYNDGSAADATVSAADLVAFEDTFDRSVAKFADEMKFKDICWLAWRALHKRAGVTDEFDAWLETIEGVEPVNVDEIVPLEKAASTS